MDELDPQIKAYLASGGRVLEGAALGRLASRPRPPPRLFARGAVALDGPITAIVGSRQASAWGLAWARELADGLARRGVTVVSGGARGIDRAAHEAALAAGGKTVIVLGAPASANDERASWMRALPPDRAITVTAYGPEMAHADHLFAARNWFIAGLAEQVVVVEGAEGSGTRYTADAARKMAIPLWACPGETASSAIAAALIDSHGARPLWRWRALELLTGRAQPELAFLVEEAELGSGASASDESLALVPLVRLVREAGGRLLIDDAASKLGVPAHQVMADAAILEIDGALRVQGGFLINK